MVYAGVNAVTAQQKDPGTVFMPIFFPLRLWMFSICGFEMIANEQPLVTEASTFTGMPRAEEPAINRNTVPWNTLPFVVGAEKGFFQREDLKVRMISFRRTNALMAALERASQFDVKMVPDASGRDRM